MHNPISYFRRSLGRPIREFHHLQFRAEAFCVKLHGFTAFSIEYEIGIDFLHGFPPVIWFDDFFQDPNIGALKIEKPPYSGRPFCSPRWLSGDGSFSYCRPSSCCCFSFCWPFWLLSSQGVFYWPSWRSSSCPLFFSWPLF